MGQLFAAWNNYFSSQKKKSKLSSACLLVAWANWKVNLQHVELRALESSPVASDNSSKIYSPGVKFFQFLLNNCKPAFLVPLRGFVESRAQPPVQETAQTHTHKNTNTELRSFSYQSGHGRSMADMRAPSAARRSGTPLGCAASSTRRPRSSRARTAPNASSPRMGSTSACSTKTGRWASPPS